VPRLALALIVLWLVSLFVYRTVVQWARTGSTGFKGFHGKPGSIPWIAGVSFAIGIVFAVVSPVAMILGWPGGGAIVDDTRAHAVGAILTVAGTVGALAAQVSMGDAWRVGVDEGETTHLVRSGLFAWVRNPIFSFMGLSVVGLLLLVPNVVAVFGVGAVALGVELQVRFVEEPYLARVHGAAYREYASRVGRFVPALGRLD